LKGIDENNDDTHDQIWNALSRRFGVIDEEMYMKRRFDSRRQKDQEESRNLQWRYTRYIRMRGHTLQLNNETNS